MEGGRGIIGFRRFMGIIGFIGLMGLYASERTCVRHRGRSVLKIWRGSLCPNHPFMHAAIPTPPPSASVTPFQAQPHAQLTGTCHFDEGPTRMFRNASIDQLKGHGARGISLLPCGDLTSTAFWTAHTVLCHHSSPCRCLSRKCLTAHRLRAIWLSLIMWAALKASHSSS